MNKLTYVLFHKVGWEQPSGEVASFVAVLLQFCCKFTKVYVCQKLWIHIVRFDKVIAKNNKGAFFCLTVYSLLSFLLHDVLFYQPYGRYGRVYLVAVFFSVPIQISRRRWHRLAWSFAWRYISVPDRTYLLWGRYPRAPKFEILGLNFGYFSDLTANNYLENGKSQRYMSNCQLELNISSTRAF